MNYELTFIHLNGKEEVSYPLTIYKDDTIDNVKSKLSEVLENKNIAEYYLFAKKKTVLNPYDMYKKLSFQNTKTISYEVFSSFCLNHELPIPEKKESYELDDFLELETSVISVFPIGIVHDTPFVVNPFQNELNQLEDSGTSSKLLWISLPDILDNTVYVCFSDDVQKYSEQEGLEISNVFNVYYPYLFSYLFKEQKIAAQVSYEDYNNVIDFHHKIYKPESILSDGITSLYFVMYTLQPFQFPLDIFFKLFQSTVKYPYIKLNGIKTNENIYRFYCNQYSEHGNKLPYLKKRTILKYARVINKNSISYLFYHRDIPIYLILDKKGHLYFHLDQIPFLSIPKIEEILKSTMNDFTNKLLEYFDPSHKIFTSFENLHQSNISILDMKYKCIYPKEGKLNVKKYMTCLSPIFNFIEEKDKITLRYKRVSNYNESQSKDAYLIESFNKNIPIEEIIQVFSANFMKHNDKAAADYVQEFFSTIEIEEKQNNLRRVKINPGFLVEIEKKENLEVTVHFIDNIQYIPFIKLYITNLILISQGIVSDNGTCKKVQEIKIVEIKQEIVEEDDVEFRMDDELEEIDEPEDMEALPEVDSKESSLDEPSAKEESVNLTEPSANKNDISGLTELSANNQQEEHGEDEESVKLTEPSTNNQEDAEESVALTEPSANNQDEAEESANNQDEAEESANVAVPSNKSSSLEAPEEDEEDEEESANVAVPSNKSSSLEAPEEDEEDEEESANVAVPSNKSSSLEAPEEDEEEDEEESANVAVPSNKSSSLEAPEDEEEDEEESANVAVPSNKSSSLEAPEEDEEEDEEDEEESANVAVPSNKSSSLEAPEDEEEDEEDEEESANVAVPSNRPSNKSSSLEAPEDEEEDEEESINLTVPSKKPSNKSSSLEAPEEDEEESANLSQPNDDSIFSSLSAPSRGGMQAEEKIYEVFIYDENDPYSIQQRFKKDPIREGKISDYFRAFQGNECTIVKKDNESCKGYVVEMNENELNELMNGAKMIMIDYFDKPGNSYAGVTYIHAQKEWPDHPTVQFVKKVYASVSYGWNHKQDDKDEMFIYDIHNELKARYNGKYYVKLDEGEDLIKIKFSPVNPLLKRLQDREPELFTKTDSVHNQYSRMCPWSEKRQPVILSKEEKERIDEIAPGSYDSVVEYGLGEKKPYYYICPRYWDLKNNVPVSPDKVDPTKLISRNASDSEKQKHIQSRYILELAKPGDKPIYQTRVGFLTKKNPSGHYMPCCFISKPKKDKPDALDKRIQEALQYYKQKPEVKEKDSDYILDGIKFPLPENRMGHLPIILELFFNVTFTDCYSQLQKKKLKVNYPCLLRQGVSEHQPFLAALSFLYFKKNMPLDAFLKVLNEKVTLDTIQTFHNGGLVHTFSKEDAEDISAYRKTKLFKTMGDTPAFKRIVNGYENFCKYLSSDDYIDYTYLWDIVTQSLFDEKVNLVILKEGLEDSTNNMTIVCPTTSHAIYTFDENKPSIMIYQKGNMFEPLFIYKKMTDEKNKTITQFDLRENIPSVHDILKKIHENIGTCKETTIHKSYRFKENLYLHELLDELKKIQYKVETEIMNIDGRIFGLMVSKKTNKPFFVPCLPSAVSGKYELLDDSLWHDYRYTVSSLKKLKEDSDHKIPCSPKIRVLENQMVVGILTETNQFIPLKEPEENKMKDELTTLEEKNHLRVDEVIQRGDIKQKERVIQHLKVEQMFYNAYFNTLKVELNDSKYINVRKKIEKAIAAKDQPLLERLFQPILDAKFLFVDKYDIDVSALDTVNLCKDSDEPYCGTLEDKGKLLIPKINLFNRTNNEEAYKNRFIDDLMMNVHIQRILFEEIHSTLYYTDRYTLSEQEILLLESELIAYLEQEPVKTIVSAVHPMIEDVSPSKIMEYANSIEPEEEAEKIPFPNGDETRVSDESESDSDDSDDSDSDSDSDGQNAHGEPESEESIPKLEADSDSDSHAEEAEHSEAESENKPAYEQRKYLPENLESLGLSDTDEEIETETESQKIKKQSKFFKNLGIGSDTEEGEEGAEEAEEESEEESEEGEAEQSEAESENKPAYEQRKNLSENLESLGLSDTDEEIETETESQKRKKQSKFFKNLGIGSDTEEEAEEGEEEEAEAEEAEEEDEEEDEAENAPLEPVNYQSNSNSEAETVPVYARNKNENSIESNVPPLEHVEYQSAESLQRRISENKRSATPSPEKAQAFVKKAKELYRKNQSPANENVLLEAQEHLQALQPKKLNKFKRIEADILPCIKTFYFKKNSKWKDYFPDRTIGFRIMKGNTYDTAIPDITCNFMMALQILKTYKEAYATITIRDLKEMLITGYKHLSSTIEVLGKKFKKEKKRFKKWEDIQMETYPFTQLDLIVLMIEYKLPVVIFIQAKKKIKLLTYQTEDTFNYYIKMKKKDVFMFFIYNKDFQIEKDDMESLYQAERDIVYLNDPQQVKDYLRKY